MKVKRLHEKAKSPTCENPGEDFGYDLFAIEDTILPVNEVIKIRTGIALEFDPGVGGIIKDRSSLASKGIMTSGGVIDSGYRGEIIIFMTFIRPIDNRLIYYPIKAGDKVAQLVLQPILTNARRLLVVEELSESIRGEKGFGSSGR